MGKRILIVILAVLNAMIGAQSFTAQPALTKISANNWQVTFGLNAAADVAVSIVNIRDSSVIRHLAAGVLGATAPAPLQKDVLSQTLSWDGRDDRGNTVTVPDADIRARVRVGLSTQLVNLIGGNPYTIGAYGGTWVNGIVAGANGHVYVAGTPAKMHQEHYGKDFVTVREFDKDGNYVKTLFPAPSNLTQAQVAGWGVVNWSDGSFSPKNANTSLPALSTSLMGYPWFGFGSALQYLDYSGQLVFGANKIMTFGVDGSCPSNGQGVNLFKSPAFPTPNPAYSMSGDIYLTPLKDGKILMSNFFHLSGTSAPDTHFYRDGKVYLGDPLTGAVTTWLAIDSVPDTSTLRLSQMGGGAEYGSLQGTALDSSNRVYVCDRLHHRIGVYDVNAAYLGALPVRHPHRVAISRNGTVYVVTQLQSAWAGGNVNTIKIVKFAPFASGGAPVCTLSVVSKSLGRSGVSAVTYFAVNDVGGQVTLWVGVPTMGVLLYRDQGTQITLFRDMGTEARTQNVLGPENPTPDRMVLDRRNERLYVSDSWYAVHKITDWSNPLLRICSTSANKRLNALDFTISPDNLLYMYEGTSYTGPVTRYTLDDRHAPAPFANTGRDTLTKSVYSRWAPCTGARGLAVSNDGRVALMALLSDRSTYYVGIYPDSGSSTTSYGTTVIGSLSSLSGCVRFDRQGNLYVGSGAYRPSPFDVQSAFLTDTGYKWGVGTVYKFNKGDSGAVIASGPVNAAKTYNMPLAPFSADRHGGCVCRSPRFELDPYGRLLVPSAVTCQVSISDNEGNLIHRFGKYGNIDARGQLPGLPGQAVVSGNDIPMLWPTSVASSEDYVYVSDYMNYRIIRAKMNYALDNYPGLTEGMATEEKAKLWNTGLFRLTSGPVPFNRFSAVNVSLPGAAHARLGVFDVTGRLVRSLHLGELPGGMHRMVWDGSDNQGRQMAAGMYVYRLEAGNSILFARTVLAK